MDGAIGFDRSPPINSRPLALSTTATGVWGLPPTQILLFIKDNYYLPLKSLHTTNESSIIFSIYSRNYPYQTTQTRCPIFTHTIPDFHKLNYKCTINTSHRPINFNQIQAMRSASFVANRDELAANKLWNSFAMIEGNRVKLELVEELAEMSRLQKCQKYEKEEDLKRNESTIKN
jgi:hypothetical protein